MNDRVDAEKNSINTAVIKPSRRFREILRILLKYKAFAGMNPEKLKTILEALGPTYVKLGQILSMRPEILSREYCAELEKLRTDVEPLSFETVKYVIESEIGESAGEVFKYIDEKPVGSASIAQVHKAVMLDGAEVVIKVQRPGIYRLMQADIELMLKNTRLISIILKTGKLIDIKSVLKELWQTTRREMDFLREADNLKRFYENNKDVPYVSCPRVIEKYTTGKVLVMEDVKGIQIDDLEALKNEGQDIDDIALKTADNYCRQILEDRFFHADPHPGNIRINNGVIKWIDLGMVGEISAQLQDILTRAVKAVLRDDMETVTEAFLMLGEAQGPVDKKKMTEEVGVIVRRYKSAEFKNFNYASLITEFINLIRKHRIRIPADISLLARSMITMEGTLGIISPEVNLSEILTSHMKNRKGAYTEELKDAGKKVYDYLKTTLGLPEDIAKTFKLLNEGRLNINITETPAPETIKHKKRQNVNIVLALLTAAFYISSAIICASPWPAAGEGFTALAAIGFVCGTILLIWILIRLWLFKNK